ncbi:hypothetical protein Clopa_0348 [Clostridium pasteurianum BC1]|uniref:Uncharacterized protein n=1 Tax=Clostridium pasteurianum BC1 TaxID=86416 RepID=R4K6Z4_CLOPA|nr:hypothetical protein Clopa_0348 [Clostridium pasteurianum BC1]
MPKLKVPYYPEDDGDNEGHYKVNTVEEKIVSEYTGYDFDRLGQLNIFEFWLLLRDAIIYNNSQTKAGREYLENCWSIDKTEPDRESIRRKMSGK